MSGKKPARHLALHHGRRTARSCLAPRQKASAGAQAASHSALEASAAVPGLTCWRLVAVRDAAAGRVAAAPCPPRRRAPTTCPLSFLSLSPPPPSLQPPSYFIPSSFIHFFMFFIPALITPGPDWPFRLAVAGFGFMTGPLLAIPRSTGKHYTFEWPATWCAYSIVQVALVLAMEAWAWGTVGRGAVRGRGLARRAKKHA